jgi:hypothetical protein
VRNDPLAGRNFFENFISKLLSLIASITMAPKPPKDFWLFFHHGEKQNTSHWKAHCKGCVRHAEAWAELLDEDLNLTTMDAGSQQIVKSKLYMYGAKCQ